MVDTVVAWRTHPQRHARAGDRPRRHKIVTREWRRRLRQRRRLASRTRGWILPPRAQVGPWAPVRFNLGRISPLMGQKEERAGVDCRSRAPALPEPSKWLPETMVLELESEVYLKLTGKWANIGRKLLKIRQCSPRTQTLRPAFLTPIRPSRPGMRKANSASAPSAGSKLFCHPTKWQNRPPSVSNAVR